MEFKTIDFGPVWLAGKKTTVQQGRTAAAFVKAFRTDGTNERLQGLPDRLSPKGDIVIWMGGYEAATRSFTEIPGIFVKPGAVLPPEYDVRELPQCTMGVCIITGNTRSITKGAHNKLLQSMNGSGFLPDYTYGFSLEYYSYEKYEKKNDVYTFVYMLPCKKAPEQPKEGA